MNSTMYLGTRLAVFGAIAFAAWNSISLSVHAAEIDKSENSLQTYAFCGDPFSVNAFGRPLDYRDPGNSFYLGVIERAHFTREVEMLIKGKTSDSPIYDLAYVLRQMPNHYRALVSVSNYYLKNEFRPIDGGDRKTYTADCYFRRALTFTNDDPVIHLIYGTYLHRSGKLESALQEYTIAKTIGLPSAELHYNLGLLYVDVRDYEAARREAKRAYELGYPLNGLRAKLERIGEWE